MRRSPRLAANWSGSVLTPDVPILSPIAGSAKAMSAATEIARLIAGWRRTRSITAPQIGPPDLHVPGAPADNRQPARVDTIAQYAEQRRQQGKRHRERRDSDEDRSVARLRKIVDGTKNRPNMAITNADPLEQDRAAGRGTGRHDRVVREPSAITLLSVSGDDEKGVIDAKR